jgi:hypothetical protein
MSDATKLFENDGRLWHLADLARYSIDVSKGSRADIKSLCPT